MFLSGGAFIVCLLDANGSAKASKTGVGGFDGRSYWVGIGRGQNHCLTHSLAKFPSNQTVELILALVPQLESHTPCGYGGLS
ncbi:MAG: hypothetical protein ACI85V_003315 [bacterium]|jgi:hypothetical protein